MVLQLSTLITSPVKTESVGFSVTCQKLNLVIGVYVPTVARALIPVLSPSFILFFYIV